MKNKSKMNTKPQAEINTVLAAVTPTPRPSTDTFALDVMSALRGKGIGATSKPIMFSTPMVSAILDGRKTQTRRIIDPQPDIDGLWNHTLRPMSIDPRYDMEGWWGTVDATGESKQYKCRYGDEGTMLWVREKWSRYDNAYQGGYGYIDGDEPPPWPPYAEHKGIRRCVDFFQQYPKASLKWRPSIHMPKSAARIFLLNKRVRVEQLHSITESDALNEGVEFFDKKLQGGELRTFYKDYLHEDGFKYSSRESFISLWKKINGEESWNQNPWVWVVEFKLIAVKGVSIQIFNK